jgi:hypothetical protein
MKNDGLEYLKISRQNPDEVVAISRKLTFTCIALLIIWSCTVVYMVGAYVSWLDQAIHIKTTVITLRLLAMMGACLVFYLSLVSVPRRVRIMSGVIAIVLALLETINAVHEGLLIIRNL